MFAIEHHCPYVSVLSRLAGGESSPPPASKGPAFPFPSAAPFGLSSSALRHVDELMSSRSLSKGSGSKTQEKLCSPSMVTLPLQHISLIDNGFRSQEFRKTRINGIDQDKWD